jgi:putative ABC transport system substrate-binding protein
MRRRDIISLIGGVAAWPLAGRAQQAESMRRVAVMIAFPEDDRLGRLQADALRQGLKELGWTDGGNIRIDFHWDVGERGRAQVIAKDIVAVQPDLIVSHAITATSAIFRLTKTIPIVFVNVADPVALGLVSSLARPGGSITGFTNFEPSMGGKWLEILKDLDPRIRRVAILLRRIPSDGSERILSNQPSNASSASAVASSSEATSKSGSISASTGRSWRRSPQKA